MKILLFLGLILLAYLGLRHFFFNRMRTDSDKVLPLPGETRVGRTKTEEFSEQASRALANEYIKRARESSLPAIRILPNKNPPSSRSASKIGGLPWWPEGKELPRSADGKTLYLLAQINLSELPENELFPPGGLLQFFIGNDDLNGLAFPSAALSQDEINKNQAGYRVILHEDLGLQTISTEAMTGLEGTEFSPIGGEYSLRFESFGDSASPLDYRWEEICVGLPELHDAAEEIIYDEMSDGGSKLGGYAYFTQQDPRAYANLPGDWVVLLQIDSYWKEGVEIMWGDSGVANFFIRQEHLKNQDFSEVWYNWDCC